MKKRTLNEHIIDFIEEEYTKTKVNEPLKKEVVQQNVTNIQTRYQKGAFLQNSFESLDYEASEGFITLATLKELRKILGDPETFQRLKLSERRAIQKSLTTLNRDEYTWKTRTKRTVHDPGTVSELFPRQWEFFEKETKIFFALKGTDTLKAQRKYFAYKAKLLVRGLSSSLALQGHSVFKKVLYLEDSCLEAALVEVDVKWVFNDVCRIILKKAHSNTFNQMTRTSHRYKNIITDDAIAAKKLSVANDFEIVFAMYIMNLVLNWLESNRGLNVDFNIISKIIRRHLRTKKHSFAMVHRDINKNWWELHCDGVRTLLTVLENCGLFRVVPDVKKGADGSLKTGLKYVIPTPMDRCGVVHFTNYPRVVKAKNIIESEDFEKRIKPILRGNVDIGASDSFKQVLNISQSKRFKINSLYLNILKRLYDMQTYDPLSKTFEKLELPFPTLRHLANLKFKLDNLEEIPVIDTIKKHQIEQVEMAFGGHEKSDKFWLAYLQKLQMVGSHLVESGINFKKHEMKLKLTSDILTRRMCKTIIDLATIYQGFPIYLTDEICSRGRCYPEQPLISRTSGLYKHLLMEYTEKKVTPVGFLHMLRSYYRPSADLTKKYNAFLEERKLGKRNSIKVLGRFFKENPLDFEATGDSVLYFMLLHAEILKVLDTGKTGMTIEIDQVASGVMLLSYFLRNRKMAKCTNALGGPPSDPYIYCRDNFPQFYKTAMKQRNSKVENFLSTDRKVHKYAIMCYCYSQTHLGRIADFTKRFEAVHGHASDEEKKVLKEFAVRYPDFIDFLFPKTKKQLKIIHEVIKIVVKEQGGIPFKNINGETFKWMFFKYKSKNRNAFDPITLKAKPYKDYKYEELGAEEKKSEKEADSDVESSTKTQVAKKAKREKPYTSYKKEKVVIESFEDMYEKDGSLDVEKTLKEKVQKDVDTAVRKSLSYIIHCIDASLIHRFLTEMWDNYTYIVNHLHDCILSHPNHVEDFYQVVAHLYQSKELYNICEESFFDHIANHVSGDTQPKILKLKKQFMALTDDFESELKYAIPENIYMPEG